jgi:hypothetical protein
LLSKTSFSTAFASSTQSFILTPIHGWLRHDMRKSRSPNERLKNFAEMQKE